MSLGKPIYVTRKLRASVPAHVEDVNQPSQGDGMTPREMFIFQRGMFPSSVRLCIGVAVRSNNTLEYWDSDISEYANKEKWTYGPKLPMSRE